MSNEIFDLDALEREGGKDPFVVKVGGETVTFSDPETLDWQDLAVIDPNDPIGFLRAALDPESVEPFFDQSVPAWKMNKLVEGYLKHFGLPMPGESKGSRSSSRGTAKR